MRHAYYFLYMVAAMLCLTTTACMDNWDDETPSQQVPFGNNSLQATNIVTIQELKQMYPNVFADTDQNKQITEDIKIMGRVTGNDLGGNIYKQFIMQDETGAIIVAVNQGGMSGFLPEGALVLISLKDLYIGGYRKMPEIGMPYNGTSIGRMQKDVFNQHFRIMGEPAPELVSPIDFDPDMDMDANCGRLVTLTGVTFNAANGTAALADPNDVTGGATNRQVKLNGQATSKKVYVRTSTYADFAATVMPFDNVNKRALPCTITGIATRFNTDWQILIRKSNDLVVE